MIRFVLDSRFPPRVPEMHTDLYEQDIMRYDHIAQWNRPQWLAVPRMPTHKCLPNCWTCMLWQMLDEKPTEQRIDVLTAYAERISS
jgi:hypothetical protein